MRGFTLGSIDIKKIGKGFLIAEGGAILAVLSAWIAAGTFNWNTLLLLEEGAVLSTLVNTAQKILDGSVQ
jgi:hypothetical protein